MHRTSLATSVLVAAVLAGGALPAHAATATTTHAATGSAAAAAYPVADALAEVAGFTKDSQKAALSEGFTAVMAITADPDQTYKATVIVDRAGNEHIVSSGDGSSGSFDSVDIAGVGSWIGIRSGVWDSVFGKSAFKQALTYLKKSGATYVSLPDPTTPKADAEATGFADLTSDLTTKTVAKADKSSFGDSGGVAKTTARKAHKKVTVARIRQSAASITKQDNAKGASSIRTRTGKVKNGVRIFAKNRYTHKVVAYKITLVKGKVVVSKA